MKPKWKMNVWIDIWLNGKVSLRFLMKTQILSYTSTS